MRSLSSTKRIEKLALHASHSDFIIRLRRDGVDGFRGWRAGGDKGVPGHSGVCERICENDMPCNYRRDKMEDFAVTLRKWNVSIQFLKFVLQHLSRATLYHTVCYGRSSSG